MIHNTNGASSPLPEKTTVKVTRDRGNPNVYHITDREGLKKQMSYGLRVPPDKEGQVRTGKPTYFTATWNLIRWELIEGIPDPNPLW